MKVTEYNCRIKSGALVGLVCLSLAGCGGGGGSPAPAPIAVASVTLPAANSVAIVGVSKSVPVKVIGSNGSPLLNRTVNWDSSNSAVASVTLTGQQASVAPIAVGTTFLTATVEGKTATMSIEVKNPPTNLSELKQLFPFLAQSGEFVVRSDISQAYADRQLAHLVHSWALLQSLYPKSPGNWSEMYYMSDPALLTSQRDAICPGRALAALPQGLVLTCSESGTTNINSWFVAPNLAASGVVEAELVTALAELGHSFSDAVSLETYRWPWWWEGLGLALESGSFDGSGVYTMGPLTVVEREKFKTALAANTLLPLQDLVALTRDRMDSSINSWVNNREVAYPQSGMLLNYLYRTFPGLIQTVWSEVNAGTVATSQQVLDYVAAATGLSAAEIDAAYRAFGAAQ